MFSKVKERLGGRVRLIVTGGAPLARHVEDFLKVCMCCPVIQGYGLTETCAASFIATPDVAVSLLCRWRRPPRRCTVENLCYAALPLLYCHTSCNQNQACTHALTTCACLQPALAWTLEHEFGLFASVPSFEE